MKIKYLLITAVLAIAILCFAPAAASAALTSTQVSAIINLLTQFGADATTITNVQTALTGGTPPSPAANAQLQTQGESKICTEVYKGTNNETDAQRFNIVFIGVGFVDQNDLRASINRIVDLDDLATAQVGSPGLMQIPVFAANKNRFNFWYINRIQQFSDKSAATVFAELYKIDWIKDCQNELPNRVIPIFIYPGQNGTGYPFASYGRRYTTLYDCIASGNTCIVGPTTLQTVQQSNIHELFHTIPCLPDEYGAWGNANPTQAPKPFTGILEGNSTLLYWIGNSYEQCLNDATWKSLIGNGCGTDGIIDCFKKDVVQPINFSNGIDFNTDSCLTGKNCFSEIGCFEGGQYADTGIWRPSAGSVMRSPYFLGFSKYTIVNQQDQAIIQKVINKGPAIGEKWEDATSWNYNVDCDATTNNFYTSVPTPVPNLSLGAIAGKDTATAGKTTCFSITTRNTGTADATSIKARWLLNGKPVLDANFDKIAQGGTAVWAKNYCPSNLTAGTATIGFELNYDTASPVKAKDKTVTVSLSTELVNGVCGSANGQTFDSAPTANLCLSGTATDVRQNSTHIQITWTWICAGANGGGNSFTCKATKIFAPNLSLGAIAGKDTATEGKMTCFSVAVVNTGTADATNIKARWMLDGTSVLDADFPLLAQGGTAVWAKNYCPSNLTVGTRTIRFELNHDNPTGMKSSEKKVTVSAPVSNTPFNWLASLWQAFINR